jgi:DTW domain-containing protein YfiP
VKSRGKGRTGESLRCPHCRLHTDLCACDVLVRMPTATELLLVAHRFEIRKTTNTGQIALLCLERARLCVRGRAGEENDEVAWAPERTPLYLFPSSDAVPLAAWKASRPASAGPVTLIVPDGTWRQAKRVRRRVPGLAHVQAVTLNGAVNEGLRLRRTHAPSQLPTLEAIARAFGILEGPGAEEHLLRAFRTVVERALWSNGRIRDDEVTTGIPFGASQDGPRPRSGSDHSVRPHRG